MNEIALIVGGIALVYAGWRTLEPLGGVSDRKWQAHPEASRYETLVGLIFMLAGGAGFMLAFGIALGRAITWHLR